MRPLSVSVDLLYGFSAAVAVSLHEPLDFLSADRVIRSFVTLLFGLASPNALEVLTVLNFTMNPFSVNVLQLNASPGFMISWSCEASSFYKSPLCSSSLQTSIPKTMIRSSAVGFARSASTAMFQNGWGDGICQNWNLSESVFCLFLKKSEFVRIGICQNWNLSEWEFVRMGICQNGNLSEWEFVRMGICQNFKMGQIKS